MVGNPVWPRRALLFLATAVVAAAAATALAASAAHAGSPLVTHPNGRIYSSDRFSRRAVPEVGQQKVIALKCR